MPDAERRRFLERECPDPRVRSEIGDLLDVAAEAEEFFESLLRSEARIDYGRELARGTRLAGYRILAPLGRGGMGRVFLAERTVLGGRQRVAIKLVRPRRGRPDLEGRLVAEGRLLTRLEHPGIARFIDGGVSEGGYAYYAMEYIEGVPLLEHCDRKRLSVPERLRLFLDVCDAVQYAHQQLIVHGDLKPAHVLIDPRGAPRLLDFGVAKILDASGDGGREDDGVWMTPAYASPERIRGDPPGTASDQYALGVVLYELLAGRRPYDVTARRPAELERNVCEESPPPPSRTVSGRLRRRLAGDLDGIVLKAIARNAANRYESVAALADDLRAHLSRRPVQARPCTFTYRASRFLQRNAIAAFSAALVISGLTAGALLSLHQAEVARSERDRARAALRVSEQIADFVTGVLWRKPGDGQLTLYTPELLDRARERATDPALDPPLRARMLTVVGRVHVETREYQTGMDLLAEAVDIERSLYPEGHLDLASSLMHLGDAQRRLGRLDASEASLRESLQMQERLLPVDHPDLAEPLIRLGHTVYRRQRPFEAVELHRRALALRRRAMPADDPRVARTLGELALSLERIEAFSEAEALLREALDRREAAHGTGHPRITETMLRLGDFLAGRRRWDEAERLYRRALRLREGAYGEHDPRLAWPLALLGRLRVDRGEHEGGIEMLERALTIDERVWGRGEVQTASTMGFLAGALAESGRYEEAEALYREVLEIEEEAFGVGSAASAGRLADIARMRAARGDFAGAEPLVARAVAIRRERGGRGLSEVLRMAAELRERRGDHAGADTLLREARVAAEPWREEWERVVEQSIRLYDAWGKPTEAASLRGIRKTTEGDRESSGSR